jgi:ketosteroid isomerase-like protein
MSQEDVELVRRSFEAWQRDDLDTWLSCQDPDIEWDVAVRQVEGAGSVYRGVEGMRAFWAAFRDFSVESDELRDVGAGRVVVVGHIRFRGPTSGIEVDGPFAEIFSVRDGKIFRVIDYFTHREALEAVGLEE